MGLFLPQGLHVHIESEQKLEPELGTLLSPLELACESGPRATLSNLIVLITEEGPITAPQGLSVLKPNLKGGEKQRQRQGP